MKYLLNIKVLKFTLIILVLISFTDCTKRWEEMNKDPNSLQTIPDEYLFTNAARGALNLTFFLNVTFGGQYAHIFIGSVWWREIDKYNGLSSYDDAQTIFSDIYRGPVKNAVEVMHLTEPDGEYPNKYRHALAEFISIIAFSNITDAFGDVPYSEAGMAKYGIYKPKYDKQEFIYSDMVDRLEKIVQLLQEPDAAAMIYPANIDPVFKGDVNKWIRLANSFRLHLAMRARFVDPGKYEPVIKECLTLPLIENNEENAFLETSSDPANPDMWNPWFKFIREFESGQYNLNFGEKFIEILRNTNDPRLPFFATKVPSPENPGDSVYLGIENGLVDSEFSLIQRSKRSLPTEKFFAKEQPLFFFTAAQTQLYKAEAVLFGLISGDANEIYRNAIYLAMDQWGINTDSINNYLQNEPEASLSGSDIEDDFRKIATQMWICNVPNAFESWNVIRRTGYPVIPQRTSPKFSKGITDGYMPTRLFYPYTGERSNNGENLQEAIDRMPGGDKIDNKVWWDVNDAPAN